LSNQADGRERTIHLVSGSKGGSGKSLFTALLADHLGRVLPPDELSVIDSVPRVGDVFRCYRNEPGVHVSYADLDSWAGWVAFAEAFEAQPARAAVINGSSAPAPSTEVYARSFMQISDYLGRKATVYWMLGNSRFATEELAQFLEGAPELLVHVVRNPYPRISQRFAAFDSSSAKRKGTGAGRRCGRDAFAFGRRDRAALPRELVVAANPNESVPATSEATCAASKEEMAPVFQRLGLGRTSPNPMARG
jgi:hypothetical protein